MQQITRGEAEAVFHARVTGGFHGRGPSDANRQVAIRPFYPNGLHYCVEDWHVLVLALVLDEELDGVSNLGEAKKLFDPVVMTFVLDGKPLDTTREPVKAFLLEFHHYAAGFSQARRMAWISAGVGCSGRAHRNLAAIRTRRSLASMSAVDGWVFVRYQGARVWRSVTSSGWWPVVAYQQTARVWQASPNGTVRSTAAGRRLRAWPTPINCLASQMATSTDQRVA